MIRFMLASCFAVLLSHSWTIPVRAQLLTSSLDSNGSAPTAGIDFIQRGNIHIANIHLDGVTLFKIAAPAAANQLDNRRSILPIEWRVNEIETRLRKLVNSPVDTSQLRVKVSTLNNQAVVVVGGPGWEQPLMTVTDLDGQIEVTSNDLLDVARQRADQITAALLRGYRERRPEHVRRNLAWLAGLGIVVGLSSVLMLKLQQKLKYQWQRLRQVSEEQRQQLAAQTDNHSLVPELFPETLPKTEPLSGDRPWLPPWETLRHQWRQLPILQQQRLNLTCRSLLWWSQIAVWLAGLNIALILFPQSRGVGIWLVGVPANFLVILLVLEVTKRIMDGLVAFWTHRWAEHDTLMRNSEQRASLRTPTINRVFQDVTLYGVIGTGLLLFFYRIQVPVPLLVTGLGVFGFSAQNLIKDWISGVLILWEDQYTEKDLIQINQVKGWVNRLNLRTTQIRTLDGELVTIANGSFDTAKNLSYQWSQVNLGIEVAYDTNLEQAIAVIEAVAEEMRHDLTWGPLILEPSKILGVDGFGDNSITIRLLLKTLPLKHQDVGREYRRRLKLAFDHAGITIPFPQRSIWLEGTTSQVFKNLSHPAA